MADRKTTVIPPADGESRMGASQEGIQGILYVPSQGGAGKGSILALDGIDASGVVTTWYFYVTSGGQLRVGSIIPTSTETGGGAV
jgi:hypothetical protein